MSSSTTASQQQRDYYAATADQYDALHVGHDAEHDVALMLLGAAIPWLKATSVLDVGAGTGRTLSWLKSQQSELKAVGIEPVEELREIGYQKGISREELLAGDGAKLQFRDGEFDLVCAFAVLHHVPNPNVVVKELLRVARRGVLISDSNNFGQGSAVSRLFKQTLHALGLWRAADLIKTRGKGYSISKEDGLAYSYSLFDSVPALRAGARSLHFLNTRDAGGNLYRTASHVAVLAVK